MSREKDKPNEIGRSSSIPRTDVIATADVAEIEEMRAELGREREALDGIREWLLQVEGELERRDRAVVDKERSLIDRGTDLDQILETAAAERKMLEADRTQTAQRLQEVIRRETEADAGFADRNEKSLAELESRRAQALAALSQLQDKMAKERAEANAKLSEEITAERSARQANLTQELGQRRERFLEDLARERMEYDQRLETERGRLAEERARTEEATAALQPLQIELREAQAEVQLEARLLEADRRALDSTVEKRVREHDEESRGRFVAKERQLDSVLKERAMHHSRIASLESSAMRFGDRTAEEVEEELVSLRTDREQLREKLARRPSEQVGEELRQLEEERDGWDAARAALQRELAELKGERHTWLYEQRELENQRDLAEAARRSRDALEAEAKRLDAQVQRLRSLHEQPKEREARIGSIEQPRFSSVSPGVQASDLKEVDWLDGIHEKCVDSGLTFPRRLLHAFHTSLKIAEWAPMTVLRGVSGTGKSELPRLYSRFGGLAFEPLSVQPNWDSPQSLFGFFNSVDNRFNATPLLRSLVQSQKRPDDATYEGGLSDRVLLVLLDELNLSHVELYFSDLLSKLELRRGAEDVSLEIDLGAGLDEYKLPLGRNVLWVGTMNEDETTKSLSDKVLDRSNVLGFPRPQKLLRRQEAMLCEPAPMLSYSTWEKWIGRTSESGLTNDEAERYKSVLDEINGYLESVGRALGHRVWQSVESYMANYPDVRAARASDDAEALDRVLNIAFEDALVQKVMPKLRGIETSGRARDTCLDPIATLLDKSNPNLGEDFELATSLGYAFVWRSARYIDAK